MRDLYEILGVSKTASDNEIKKAYRKIAMNSHPDRNPGDTKSEKTFKDAADAYSILSDSSKRAKYDQFGHAGVGMGEAPGQGGFGGGGIHMSMDDIFSQFGDIFGGRNPFEDIFGGGGRSRTGARKARDLRISLEVSLQEILNGVEKTIKIKRQDACGSCAGSGTQTGTSASRCKQCGGSGQVRRMTQTFFGQSVAITDCPICHGSGEMIEHPCRACGGQGVERKTASIKINIPAGVESGNYMTLEGQGNKGGRGIHPGDLIVFFEEKEHPYFTRHGSDIVVEAQIQFWHAVLGTTIKVPTIEGHAGLKIPAGIQNGQILRMRGKGLPQLQRRHVGDELVRIRVIVPKSINRKEKDLIQSLSELNPDDKAKFQKIEL